jgi:subtilisin family serine protease
MNKKAMVYVGKALDRAVQIVEEHSGIVLANYGQSLLVRIEDAGLQALQEAGNRTRELPEQPVVHIGGFALDTAQPSARSTAAAAVEMALPSGRSHHVVRFVGPMHPDWKTQLERMGAILVESVGTDQYLVAIDSARLPELQALGFVESVSPYYPAFKINSNLLTTEVQDSLPAVAAISPLAAAPTERAPAPSAPAGALTFRGALRRPSPDPEQVGNLEVTVFDGEDPLAVVDAVRALGARVIRASGQKIILYAAMSLVAQIAAIPQVRAVNPYRPPALANYVATGIIHADVLHDSHGLDGSGQIVAIADTGLDSGVDDAGMHDDFEGRIVSIHALGRPGDASDIDNHGTHVAGSVLGNGAMSNGLIQGMAPAARVVFQSTMDANRELGGLPDDLEDGLFDVARDDGAHMHTNSWGAPLEGAYTDNSDSTDTFAFNNREFLIVFAAGNWVWDEITETWLTGINAPGTAKNALTVGASESEQTLPDRVNFPASPAYPHGCYIDDVDDEADNRNQVAGFSCVGPAQNNRRKPDVVAPGSWILSTRSSVSTNDCGPDGFAGTGDEDGIWTHAEAVGYGLPGQPIFFGGDEDAPDAPPGSGAAAADNYCWLCGTSMATPITAGACALLRQYLIEQRGHTPSAALLKALIINGAVDMGMGVPHNDQGWGRVDLTNTLFPTGTGRVQFDDSLDNALTAGDTNAYDVWVSSAAEPLAVTLVWRDPPGATIQNPLHLRVIHVDSGTESTCDDIADICNNVQKVVVDPPQVGQYRIEVHCVNVTTGVPGLAGLRQDYALVVANATGFSCNPADIVQVIDRSGSMGYSGYMEPAKERAKQMIDILQINDHAGLVSFEASAVEDMPLTVIDAQDDKDAAHALIDPITSWGMTDLREALEQGTITLGVDAGRPRAIVFLTDGKHTQPPPEIDDPFLDGIASANIKVYAIALGQASDFTVLNNIASRTGTGSVYTVESAADVHKLQEIYYDIIGGMGCGGVVHLTSTPLAPGGTMQQEAVINAVAREGFFAAAWARRDAEIAFKLKSPSGRIYDPSTPDACFFRGSSHAFYRITRPEAGTWKLIVHHGGGGGNQLLTITTAAMADTDVQCQVELDPKYLYDDKILLRLTAQFDGQPLTGGKAIATITFPTKSIDDLLEQYADELKEMKLDEKALNGDKVDPDLVKLGDLAVKFLNSGKDIYEREQVRIELTDDGREADPKADDGVYTAFFDPKAAGVAGNYSIQVSFEVKHDKLGLHRCTRLIPVYVPRPEKPVTKLVIKDIFVRRNRLWRYIIVGAVVLKPDGTLATPNDGVSVSMLLTQGLHRVKSGDLPYYSRGGYYIWRLDMRAERLQPGLAVALVQAKVHGLLAAQVKQTIRL